MNNNTISGKYRIDRELGRGGMGIVYEAHDMDLNRPVAIKELHAQFTGDSAFLTRFQREARAMARLDHGNIIRVLEWVEDGGSYYIVMEYFQGKNLKEILNESDSLTKKECLSIMLQMAKALSYAHKHGIIHRDIKPENIMVNDAGLAKIADFGIAAATDEVSVTMTGQVIGTPRYMSPEQARGEELDSRSDLYSLGVVLYEMLTGQALYRGIPSGSIYESLLSDLKELRLAFPSDIPSPLQDLVRSLLRKKVEKRLSDAARLADRLSDILSKYDETLAQTRMINSLPQTGSRQRNKLLFTTLAVLLFVGIGAYLILRPHEVPTKKEILEQEKSVPKLPDLQQKKEETQRERERKEALLQAEQEQQQQKEEEERVLLEQARAKDERERLAEERVRVARELETQVALVAAEQKILALEKAKAEQARLEQEKLKQEKATAEQMRLEQKKAKAEQKRLAEESTKAEKEIEKQREMALAEQEKLRQEKAKAEQMRLKQKKVKAEQKRLAEESTRAEKEIKKQQAMALAEQKKLKQEKAKAAQARLKQEEKDKAARARLEQEKKDKAEREQKIASLASPEADGDLIGNILNRLETAYEKKDLASLQKMSEMPPEKSRFLSQIFKNYQKVQVSITGVSLSGNTAQAIVTITALTSQTGDPAFPFFLRDPTDQREVAHVTLRKQNERWGKVIW